MMNTEATKLCAFANNLVDQACPNGQPAHNMQQILPAALTDNLFDDGQPTLEQYLASLSLLMHQDAVDELSLYKFIFYIRLFTQHRQGRVDHCALMQTKPSLFDACFSENVSDRVRKELFRIVEELSKASIEVCRDVALSHFDAILKHDGFHLI